MVSARTARVLAQCNGYRVKAGDHVVGAVATPVFAGASLLPEYLLIRVEAAIPGIFRAVPPELVAEADAASETVVLEIDPAEVTSLPIPPRLDRVSPPTTPLHDYGALVRHRLATQLTVIRGSALTLRDLPALHDDEVRQLAAAIERAAHELEHATLDPVPFKAAIDNGDAEPTAETETSPHSAVAIRVATRAAALAIRKTLVPADVDLLELEVDELRGFTR